MAAQVRSIDIDSWAKGQSNLPVVRGTSAKAKAKNHRHLMWIPLIKDINEELWQRRTKWDILDK